MQVVPGAGLYQRAEGRTGYADGFKPKTFHTRFGEITVAVPQARSVELYPSALEKGIRSERVLKLIVAEMYVQGVSTRKSSPLPRNSRPGSDQLAVSWATSALDEELEKRRNCPQGRTLYLILDARYEKVRHGGSVVSSAVMVAIGVGPDGKRLVLGARASRCRRPRSTGGGSWPG